MTDTKPRQLDGEEREDELLAEIIEIYTDNIGIKKEENDEWICDENEARALFQIKKSIYDWKVEAVRELKENSFHWANNRENEKVVLLKDVIEIFGEVE